MGNKTLPYLLVNLVDGLSVLKLGVTAVSVNPTAYSRISIDSA